MNKFRLGLSALLLCSGSLTARAQERLNFQVQQAHSAQITRIALDPMHRFVISGDISGNLKFWDYKTGVQVKSIRIGGDISDIQIDPVAMKMVTCDYDLHRSLLWDLNDLTPELLPETGWAKHVLMRPHSHQLVWCQMGDKAGDGVIKFLDLTTRKVVDSCGNNLLAKIDALFDDYLLAFSADGHTLAASVSYTARENGKFEFKVGIALIDLLQKKLIGFLKATGPDCRAASFSANGKMLIVVGENDEINIWDTATQTIQRTVRSKTGRYAYAAFLDNNQIFAVLERRGDRLPENQKYVLECWEPAFKKLVARFPANLDAYMTEGMSLASDGHTQVVYPDTSNNLRVIDAGSGTHLRAMGLPFQPVLKADFDAHTGDFIVAKENGIAIWNSKSQTFHSPVYFGGHATAVTLNQANTKALAFTGQPVKLIDIRRNSVTPLFKPKSNGGFLNFDLTGAASTCISPDGNYIVLGNHQGQAMLSKSPFAKLDEIFGDFDMGDKQNLVNPMNQLAISPNNRYVVFAGSLGPKIKIFDRVLKKLTVIESRYRVSSVTMSKDNRLLAFLKADGIIHLCRLGDAPAEIDTIRTPFGEIENLLKFSDNGNEIALASFSGEVMTWDWRQHRMTNDWNIGSPVKSCQYIHHDSLLVAGDGNASFKVFANYTHEQLLTVSFFNDRDWIAYSPEGFFDGTENAWELFPAGMPGKPWEMIYPEQLFNVFYQPGIIQDILDHNQTIRAILNERKDKRTNANLAHYIQTKIPQVTMLSQVTDPTDRSVVHVKFQVNSTGSGMRDLKVFHNQMLVYEKSGKLQPTNGIFTADVPIQLLQGDNTISAYCFNDDNIRSREIRTEVKSDHGLPVKGDLHILSIGITAYQQAQLKLKYAAADAQLFSTTISENLLKTGNYRRSYIHHVPDAEATKAKLITQFRQLGTGLARLKANDVLFIFYSGHGFASGDNFYLVPQDASISADGRSINNLLSDTELSDLLKNIDCKEIVLVIDACQSGQAIGKATDQLGPFNAKGLAQLAYEKGMYVIAASQSQQSAIEVDTLAHGLLTYTMSIKGLKQSQADNAPKDKKIDIIEWLNYTAQEVPKTYLAAKQQKVQQKKIVPGKMNYQNPKVYFRREKNYDLLIVKNNIK